MTEAAVAKKREPQVAVFRLQKTLMMKKPYSIGGCRAD